MEIAKLKKKLKIQFSEIISNDKNLVYLEKIFETMSGSNYSSQVPEEHYKVVDERRRKSIAGETKGLTWEEIKNEVKGRK